MHRGGLFKGSRFFQRGRLHAVGFRAREISRHEKRYWLNKFFLWQNPEIAKAHSYLEGRKILSQGQVAPSAPVPIPRRTQGRARAGLSSRGTLKRLFLPCIGRRLLLTGWRKGGNGGHPAEGQRPRMREEGRREKSLEGHRRPEKREGKEGTSCPSTATGGHKGTDSRMGRMREEGQEEISTVGGQNPF